MDPGRSSAGAAAAPGAQIYLGCQKLVASRAFFSSAAASIPTPRGAMARREGFELYALTVRYGQVHGEE